MVSAQVCECFTLPFAGVHYILDKEFPAIIELLSFDSFDASAPWQERKGSDIIEVFRGERWSDGKWDKTDTCRIG